MKVIEMLCILAVIVTATLSYAQQYTIKPKYFDPDHSDGIDDPGSPANPYVLTDESGQKVGTVVIEDDNPWGKRLLRPDERYKLLNTD